MATAEKEQAVEALAELIARSKSIYLTDFQGMNVELVAKMRRRLRDAKVEYRVAKNTLTKIALRKQGVDALDSYLEGPTGIAFGADEVGGAKILSDFAKEFEKPSVKAAYVAGTCTGRMESRSWLSFRPARCCWASSSAVCARPCRVSWACCRARYGKW